MSSGRPYLVGRMTPDEEPTFRADRIVDYIVSKYGDDVCLIDVSMQVKELMDNGVEVTQAHVDYLFRNSQVRRLREWIRGRELAKEIEAKQNIKSPGFVYFIEHGHQIKIGHSVDPAARAKALSLRPSNVIAVIEGTQTLERNLHKKFAAWRIDNTEWFQDCPEIREHIAEFGEPFTRHHRSIKGRAKETIEDSYIQLAEAIVDRPQD